ncbi:rhomboid family intramembrane serine protease [Sanguibacter sp. A247]|uniref:rhomboid family intramembrane serine protease n=1 Tax=unclassified Sanguibacter TaxID=2645534 RepID=UPI003FD7CA3B
MSDNVQTGGAAAPVCPRHPDRPSYVMCQRCGRPACIDCQRPAAVGVHCVDCVAEQARRAPVTRTILGARAGDERPVITIVLIAICVVSYVLQRRLGVQWTGPLEMAPVLGAREPWRLLTATFLHVDSIAHIAFNMIALWSVGPTLEHVLGRGRFLSLYLLSALGGSVAVVWLADPLTSEWNTAVRGASGAVFGLFGAFVVVLRRFGRDASQVYVVIALNVVIGFVIPRIAWEAHLGGFVVGAAVTAAFAYAPRERRHLWAFVVPIVGTVALVAAVSLRFATVPEWTPVGDMFLPPPGYTDSAPADPRHSELWKTPVV